MGLFEVVATPKSAKDKKAGKHLAWIRAGSTLKAAQSFVATNPKWRGTWGGIAVLQPRSKKTGRFTKV